MCYIYYTYNIYKLPVDFGIPFFLVVDDKLQFCLKVSCMGMWCSQPSRASCSEGPALSLMLCCPFLETTENFWTRGPELSFCSRPRKFCRWSNFAFSLSNQIYLFSKFDLLAFEVHHFSEFSDILCNVCSVVPSLTSLSLPTPTTF